MVATRKSVNLHSTSYSQMPAQEMWQREAAEEEASEEEASEEDDTLLLPLSMADGGHLLLQLEDDCDNMPPLFNPNQRDDDDSDDEEDVRDPIYDNPSQLMPPSDDDFQGPPKDYPTPPPTPSPVEKPSFLQQSQRSYDAADLCMQPNHHRNTEIPITVDILLVDPLHIQSFVMVHLQFINNRPHDFNKLQEEIT